MTKSTVASTRWLVTGGLGFIGLNLVCGCYQITKQICLLDNMTASSAKNACDQLKQYCERASIPFILNDSEATKKQFQDGLPFVSISQEDINSSHQLEHIVAAVDVVVHLAASPGVLDSITRPGMILTQMSEHLRTVRCM